MYVTEQLRVAPEPLAGRAHFPLAGLKVPVPLLVKVTVPVGVLAGNASVSVTVAVHVVVPPARMGLGPQVTVVVVERLLTFKVKVPELLVWDVSGL